VPLVTGCGRGGTLSAATLLNNVGIGAEHEGMKKGYVSVSWLYAATDDFFPFENQKAHHLRQSLEETLTKARKPLFDPVVHLVRNPLDAISSTRRCFCGAGTRKRSQGYYNDMVSWKFVERHVPEMDRTLETDDIRRSMQYWLYWNKLILTNFGNQTGGKVVRLEDMDGEELVARLGMKGRNSSAIPKRVANAKSHKSAPDPKYPTVTWIDLFKADKSLANQIWRLAVQFGYEEGDPSKEKFTEARGTRSRSSNETTRRAEVGGMEVSERGAGSRLQMFPRTYVIGTMKGATSSLHEFLTSHPRLCGAVDKEQHFFEKDEHFEAGVSSYLKDFGRNRKCRTLLAKGCSHCTVDSTPSYMRFPIALERIVQSAPPGIESDLRFIVVLREPVSREMAMLNHFRQHNWPFARGYEKEDGFEKYFQMLVDTADSGQHEPFQSKDWGLWFGFYDLQLTEAFKILNPKQVMILNFDTLISDQDDSLRRILRFLSLSSPDRELDLPSKNRHKQGNNALREGKVQRDLSLELCEQVAALYEPHNQALYKMMLERRANDEAPEDEPVFRPFSPPCKRKPSANSPVAIRPVHHDQH